MTKNFTFSLNGVRYSASLTGLQVHKLFNQEQLDMLAISQLAIDKAFQKALVEAGRATVIGDAIGKGKSKTAVNFDDLD